MAAQDRRALAKDPAAYVHRPFAIRAAVHRSMTGLAAMMTSWSAWRRRDAKIEAPQSAAHAASTRSLSSRSCADANSRAYLHQEWCLKNCIQEHTPFQNLLRGRSQEADSASATGQEDGASVTQ